MNQFLHIGLHFADGNNKVAELIPVFSNAIDWLRYAPNCWIVWTSSSPQEWYQRLKPFLKEADRLFIVKIDMSVRQGWLEKNAWDWMDKRRP